MRVPGLIFVNDTLLEQVKKDQAPDQVANVAFLPGIQGASIAMPDIHWGYGFCIGGVAATNVVVAPTGTVVAGLTLYYSTVFAEVVRSGIRSVPRGQTAQTTKCTPSPKATRPPPTIASPRHGRTFAARPARIAT